jgi:Ca-activated chloride channel family protein
VDLTSVHIGRARSIEVADGIDPVVSTPAGAPLVAVGAVDGEPMAVIAFDLDESDLPLQVAFPLLMSNVVDALLPVGEGILPSSMRLGEPIRVRVDPAIERVAVSDDDGTTREVPVIGGELTLPGADRVGLRELTAIRADPDLDGEVLGMTAVNLFNSDESDVTPGDPTRLVDMGRVPDDAPTGTQPARAEWWWPLALAALALLAVEWLLFHRPTRRSLGRVFGRRPQPLGGRAR